MFVIPNISVSNDLCMCAFSSVFVFILGHWYGEGGGYNCLFVTSIFCFANDLFVCDVQNWCLC